MKVYNVTKGQLITIWVFGLIATFVALVELDSYNPSGWATVFLILIPATLVFYTIGWRVYEKNITIEVGNGKNINHCTDCGENISVESKFCKTCGKKLYV